MKATGVSEVRVLVLRIMASILIVASDIHVMTTKSLKP
jgi:hypothetical protein